MKNRLLLVMCLFLFVVGTVSPAFSAGEVSLSSLIELLREESAESLFSETTNDYIDEIVLFGDEATDPLIHELKTTDDDVMRRNVINALSRISSEKRDQAFIEVVQNYQQDKSSWVHYIGVVFETLAESGNEKAIPSIRKAVHSDAFHFDDRILASVALNRLGGTAPLRETEEILRLDDQCEVEMEKETSQAFLNVMDQAFVMITTSTMVLQSVKEEPVVVDEDDTGDPDLKEFKEEFDKRHPLEMGDMQSVFEGKFEAHEGEWSVTVSVVNPEKASAICSYYRANLWGAEYYAYLEKREGRWLVVKWKCVLMS